MSNEWFIIIAAIALAATAVVYLRAGVQYAQAAKAEGAIAAAMAVVLALSAIVAHGEYSTALNSAPFWVVFLPTALPMAVSVIVALAAWAMLRAKSKR